MPGVAKCRQSIERAAREMQKAGLLAVAFSACNSYAGGFDRAHAVSCPTLLVLGTNDQMTPIKAGRVLAAKIKDSKVIEVKNSGHALMSEQPDAVLNALRDFITLPIHSSTVA